MKSQDYYSKYDVDNGMKTQCSEEPMAEVTGFRQSVRLF